MSLADLLAQCDANKGTMPDINPPEAAKVLAACTTPEVAGEPVPELPPVTVPAPVAKPADVVAKESTRRTAKVVQDEFDQYKKDAELIVSDHSKAMARIQELEAQEVPEPLELTDRLRALEAQLKTAEDNNVKAARVIEKLQGQLRDAEDDQAGRLSINADGHAHCLDALGFTVTLTYRGDS